MLAFTESLRGFAVIVLFFGGSIFVHELGHFLAAKRRGLRVERFSIGFGPKVFGWRGKDGVDYRVSLLPLGGYVAIPELADMELIEGKSEAAGEDGKGVPAKKISYADKVIVFAAGAFFNVLFAALLACVLWAVKSPTRDGYESSEIGYVAERLETEPGVFVAGPAREAGLRPGDRILSVDGETTENFSEIMRAVALGTRRDAEGRAVSTVRFARGNETIEADVFPRLVSHNPRSGDFIRMIGVAPTEPLIVAPREGMPAAAAGARFGDRWLEAETEKGVREKLHSFAQFQEILEKNGAAPLRIFYERDGNAAELTLAPKLLAARAPLAKIRFREDGTERALLLAAAPQDLNNTALAAKRDTLRVAERLPAASAYAELFAPGTQIDGVALEGEGILAPKSVEEFSRALPQGVPCRVSLFLTRPDGEGANARFSEAIFETETEAPKPFAGVSLVSGERLVRKTPWAQFAEAFDVTFKSVVGLLNPNSDVGVSHLNGVFSIGDTYYAVSSNLRSVLVLTVLININLAILNLLPIPVLDGGHILVATIQRLRRRPIPANVVNGVQVVFICLLLLFMGYVLFKDFARFRGNRDLAAAEKMGRFLYTPEFLAMRDVPFARADEEKPAEK